MSASTFPSPIGPPPRVSARARAGSRGLAASTLVALGLAGCGALSGEPERPTRLTGITGDATALAIHSPKSLHVTVLWRTLDAAAFTPQDDAALMSPGPFALDVRRPPPEVATHRVLLTSDESTAFGFAIGALVAYDDLDGDGALTLVPGSAATSTDRLLAANPLFFAVWLDRPPSAAEARLIADGAGRVPSAGLNFQRVTSAGSRWVAASEPYEFGAADTTALPDRVCSSLYESPAPDSSATKYDLLTSYPPAGALGLHCEEKGTSFTFQPCAALGLCAVAPSCKALSRRIGSTETAPPGWPCGFE